MERCSHGDPRRARFTGSWRLGGVAGFTQLYGNKNDRKDEGGVVTSFGLGYRPQEAAPEPKGSSVVGAESFSGTSLPPVHPSRQASQTPLSATRVTHNYSSAKELQKSSKTLITLLKEFAVVMRHVDRLQQDADHQQHEYESEWQETKSELKRLQAEVRCELQGR